MKTAGEHLVPDEFFKSLVCSIYYDTEDFTLIRASIEGPVFKQKLRLRSYGVPGPEGKVFVELKKKYKGTVYKRRVSAPAYLAEAWLAGSAAAPEDSQTCREIDNFLKFYQPRPAVSICCDRTSYVDKDNPELRITIDSSVRWRDEDLSLTSGDRGRELLENGDVLMEIKIPAAAPLWLAELLSREGIFPTSYSKYGNCYKKEIIKKTVFADF